MARQSFAILAILDLCLLCATGQKDFCASEDTASTETGQQCKNYSSVVEGAHTKTLAMNLLMGGQAERMVVNDSEYIFVSIKTTQKYHATRLPPVLLTWIQTVQPEQVSFQNLWLQI